MHESLPFPSAPPRALFTVRQFSERLPAFSQASLRRLIYYALPRRLRVGGRVVEVPANGFEPVLIRVGRRVLIDEVRFFEWIKLQQKGGAA